MKSAELRQMSEEDLNKELLALNRELFNLRVNQSVGQASKPHNFSRVRREIARVKTIMTEKAKGEK